MLFSILGALLIGLTLGLLGSGGSILTVPVLVYLLGHSDKVAIAESLAIVAGIAFAGMLPYARSHQINWRNVVYFGLPGMGGTYSGAWLSKFVPGAAQLTLFAILMLLAAGMMLRKREKSTGHPGEPHSQHPFWQISLEGFAVGILTGLVGVGGGFLIVPALVLLGGLSMRIAVGTSLFLIFLNSAVGFWKYTGVLAGLQLSVDWGTIALFLAIGTIGSYTGRLISGYLDQDKLKRVFAVFLLLMGCLVLGKEVPHLLHHQQETAATQAENAELTPTGIAKIQIARDDFASTHHWDAHTRDIRRATQ